MLLLPRIRVKFGEGVGSEVFIQPPDIGENERTYLTTDSSAAASSLSVENGLKFATGEYLVVGNIGSEKSEIVKVSSTASGSISLDGTATFAHNRGERLQFVPYNQIKIQRSTDGGSTYNDLTTVDLRVDSTETYYNDTGGLSTYYYRAKFYNATSTGVSSNSDGIIATGFEENSAGAIIRDALISLGETIDNEVLTKEFLLRALDEGRDDIDLHERIERWSFRTVFDYDGGNIIPGRYTLTLPTDIRDSDTSKNLLSVRIGRDNLPLYEIDKRALNDHYRGVAHTTLNGILNDSDVTINLTSSGDFDESGSVDIAAESVSGIIDPVAYTANNESTNALSGVTGIVTGGHADGRDVWQGASFGYPIEYSVYEDKIVFSQPFGDDLAGENIYLDYYKKKTLANSEGDTLDESFYRIYLPYLRYRIKLRKNPQMVREEDDDYKMWVEKREAQVNKEFTGQDLRISVDTPDRSII